MRQMREKKVEPAAVPTMVFKFQSKRKKYVENDKNDKLTSGVLILENDRAFVLGVRQLTAKLADNCKVTEYVLIDLKVPVAIF